MIDRRATIAALSLALLAIAVAAKAAPASSWDGRWTGKWGGKDETEVIIADGKIVRYSFKGDPRQVETKEASDNQFSFGNDVFTVVMTKTSEAKATAQFQSNAMGQVSATLTKQ
jgi:hypothetical protein